MHGLAGELTLFGCSLTADEVLAIGSFHRRDAHGGTQALTLERVRPVHGHLLVGFRGYPDRGRAAELAQGDLLADAASLPDPGPDTAYVYQLIGLEVVTVDGRRLGTVAEVMQTGAHPIYVVRGEREILVPATTEVVRRVDLEHGVITVSLPLGLEEL